MHTSSWVELSESALKNNLNFIKKTLPENTVFSSVVKGNAYGHNIELYCPLAYKLGVRHFSVFSAFEAKRLFDAVNQDDITILIMGDIMSDQMSWVIQNNVEFFVFNQKRLEHAIEVAKKLKKKAFIHLELETGLNRTGIVSKELGPIYKLYQDNLNVVSIEGVCTHLAGAESIANYKRIQGQIKKFKQLKRKISNRLGFSPKCHIACSAAVINYPNHVFDLARIGILQYGFFPNDETYTQYFIKNKISNPLKRVISWKTRVMDLKKVNIGEFVGYGNSFFTNDFTEIALIPVGYSDGFARSLSNNGKVLIHGNRLNVIGTINMNMMAVDITSVKNVKIGDEVILIGNQGDLEISVASFSDFSDQVNYELLVRLPSSINRRIVK